MKKFKRVSQGDSTDARPKDDGAKKRSWIEPERYLDPFVRSTVCAVNLLLRLSGRHFEAGKFRLDLGRVLASRSAGSPNRA